MSYNNLKFFDFEVFPEWWCVVISDELPEERYKSVMYHCHTDKEEELQIKSKMRVYTSDDANVVELLREDFSHGVFAGYNNKSYDNKIAKCVMRGLSPEKVFKASEILINPNKAFESDENMRIASFVRFGYDGFEAYQDFLDDSFKGLKDKEASYGLDIRETTVPFGKRNLTQQEKEEIIYYCKHDVYALHVHYSSVARAYVDTKVQLAKIFGLSLKTAYCNTNAVLSGKILDAVRVHGTSIKDPTIQIHNEKLDNYFKKYIPTEVYNHLISSQESRSFEIYENKVDVADGGVHSVYNLPKINKSTPAIYIESTDEYAMYNIDTSSHYTSVMIYCNTMSRGIKNPDRLRDIYFKRMKLKATPKSEWLEDDKYFVNAAKLVINTTYGAMGNEYLPLYDEYMRSKTCRIGQMVLIAIANALFVNIPGLKVIQNNTDGVLVYAKRADRDKIQKVIDEFSEISKFIFEVDEDNYLWQLNVNNYVAIDPNGKMKDKGGAFVHDIHQPGYYHIRPLSSYCVPKAQIDFYRNKTNPVMALLQNTKVEDFCVTCTKGPGYYGMSQLNKDKTVELGKVARVIAVKDENLGVCVKNKWQKIKPNKAQTLKGITVDDMLADYIAAGKQVKNDEGIWKVHQTDKCALCPEHSLVVNDALYNYTIKDGKLIHKDGRSWQIDYGYYADELEKALNVVWYKLKNDKVELTREFNI